MQRRVAARRRARSAKRCERLRRDSAQASTHDAITGFFTDSTLCIGCKACEVACKEWNDVPSDGFVWTGISYDNTGALGHSTWRHVKFVEHDAGDRAAAATRREQMSWEFSSDVCKHCENAGCLEACPTGSIVRTEFGGVYVQPDVCNGCGYCVVACPFGVVDRRPDDGRAFKCTFCYDRQKAGCSRRARRRVRPSRSSSASSTSCAARADAAHRGAARARHDRRDDLRIRARRSVGGTHAIFLVRGDPRRVQPARESGGADELPDATAGGRRRAAAAARCSAVDRCWRLRSAAADDERRYYGLPLLKPPVWTWEVPLYFFVGGAAGAAAVIGARRAAHRRRRRRSCATRAGSPRSARPLSGAAAHRRPRPARALPQHAARLQAAVADVGRRMDARRRSAAQRPARVAGPRIARRCRRRRRRAARPGDGDLHRRAARRDRDSGLDQHAATLPIHFGASALGSAASLLELRGHDEPALNASPSPPPRSRRDGVRIETADERGARAAPAKARRLVIRAGGVLEVPGYKVHASRRDAPGEVEVHLWETDLIYVVDGEATLVTGGTMVGPRETEPGQIRAPSSVGGVEHHLAKGDVVVIPNGEPHWFKEVSAPFLYFTAKPIAPKGNVS